VRAALRARALTSILSQRERKYKNLENQERTEFSNYSEPN
jgi:hypothetical protein